MNAATGVAIVLAILAIGVVLWLVIARPGDPIRSAQAEALRLQAEAEAARRTPKGERATRIVESIFGFAGQATQAAVSARSN